MATAAGAVAYGGRTAPVQDAKQEFAPLLYPCPPDFGDCPVFPSVRRGGGGTTPVCPWIGSGAPTAV